MDYSLPWQIGFQFPATTAMLGIIELHNHICFFIIFIIVFTFYMLIFILKENSIEYLKDSNIFLKVKYIYNIKILHNVSLETLWIILPTIILLAIAIPSFALLYGMEVSRESLLTLKVIGHQWYWSYDLTQNNILIDKSMDSSFSIIPLAHYSFDSYMVYDTDLTPKGLRLLETTNPIVLPVKTNIKVLVTSDDVLHSWAIPSFGVKIDACPGRLNQIMLYVDRIGHFYGQCSELCGVNHGFMPIEVYSINRLDFVSYMFYVSKDFSSNLIEYPNFINLDYKPYYFNNIANSSNFSLLENSNKKNKSFMEKINNNYEKYINIGVNTTNIFKNNLPKDYASWKEIFDLAKESANKNIYNK